MTQETIHHLLTKETYEDGIPPYWRDTIKSVH